MLPDSNQLIGALALTTVTVWLLQRARQHLFTLVPAVFMVATTFAALYLQASINLSGENHVLGYTAVVLLVLSVGVVVMGVTRFAQALQQTVATPMESGADRP